ncbi:glycogen synthase [Zhongshania sp. BJYM1]|uniref:glycogen synthase n=1 Tax=Zhongshania aquatica TaxID=2965069 RepID=UPI0022B3D458|nr:glycogen/starch synthase [Marortus sp. BJYM1]
MKILMVAAENAVLPGGKVGGIGDVIRDIPAALAELGHQVDVVIPGYQHFSKLPGAKRVGAVDVSFRGVGEHLEIFELTSDKLTDGVRCWVVDHPLFAPCGSGKIYCNDPPGRPFASDASKFALFGVAVAQACIEQYWPKLDVIHLHDWHAAFIALLVRYMPAYQSLAKHRMVYTIHNLSLQGVRPVEGDESSLHAWFPQLHDYPQEIVDTRYSQCVNPMRMGINLCDRVQAVSPSYAREIQAPSNIESGYVGGEGLEDDLRRAASEGRLKGILNGAEYPKTKTSRYRLNQLLDAAETQLLQWVAATPLVTNSNLLALRRADIWRRTGGGAGNNFLMTSVGRLTDQKVTLLLKNMPDGRPALEHLLERLGTEGRMILLGSGDTILEQKLVDISARHQNFMFLCGYADTLTDVLYDSGDLFLMPSSFEPCGISQMLAMRAGQPCLVHHVGGLIDTVIDGENGFAFSGANQLQQMQNMIRRFDDILILRSQKPEDWNSIRKRAKDSRFLWSNAAKDYVSQLYS